MYQVCQSSIFLNLYDILNYLSISNHLDYLVLRQGTKAVQFTSSSGLLGVRAGGGRRARNRSMEWSERDRESQQQVPEGPKGLKTCSGTHAKYPKIALLGRSRGGKAQKTHCKQLKSKWETVITDGKCWFLFLKKSG